MKEEKIAKKDAGHSGNRIRTVCAAVVSLVLTGMLLLLLLGTKGNLAEEISLHTNLMDKFDMYMSNSLSHVLDGLVERERVYWLSDSDMVAPEPRQECFGQVEDPAQIKAVLEDASRLLKGQETLFTTETPIKEGTPIRYYLDETIFAVTWKQVYDNSAYTFSEIKIAHPSQFRRFLSEGKFGSGVLHTTTEMAASVNAVVASAGDYYGYRTRGITINDHQVYRSRGHLLDTCYIDENGDLLFTYAGEITDDETAQAFVEEHNIRFSLSFGPVIILDGEVCVPRTYDTGEITQHFARAALCQLDSLHYVVVVANYEKPNYNVPTLAQFARSLQSAGIHTAYALDGGQTATIVMNDQLINKVSHGSQREISDIIYFATALPENG